MTRWTAGMILLPVLVGCGGAPAMLAEGSLPPCPDSPNCVSSLAQNPGQRVAPLAFDGDVATARGALLDIVAGMPRGRVVGTQPNMIQVEFRSCLFRFKDDLTFLFDAQAKVIHLRSASRSGYYDFGVNRKRAQTIALAWDNLHKGDRRDR